MANSKHKLRFSGHESFVCRISWLHKGLDFVTQSAYDFNAPEAVIELGVGKNMVNAIRFWLRAFGLTDEADQLSRFGRFLRNERQAAVDVNQGALDPYFEMQGTTWLLFYSLVSSQYATIFDFYFNHFQSDKVQFTESQLQKAIERWCSEQGFELSGNTLSRDIAVFLRTLQKPEASNKADVEDLYSSALTGLDLMTVEKVRTQEGNTDLMYKIQRDRRPDLPWQVFLFALKQKLDGRQTASLKDLLSTPGWPGLIFCMSKEGLLEKIEELTVALPEHVTFSQSAGNEVLQFGGQIDEWEVLRDYYQN